jgi:integration host factor subunit alpha
VSLGKKDIAKNISSKAQISSLISTKILNEFIKILSSQPKERSLKISNFGTFYYHKTPKRIGRNPKTKEEFSIKERYKLSLKVSNNIKKLIN